MSAATVTSKGQITKDLMSLYGMVKPAVRGVTLEDMEKAIRSGQQKGDRSLPPQPRDLLQVGER